jgi:hypothetical protein
MRYKVWRSNKDKQQGFVVIYAHVSKLNLENPIGIHGACILPTSSAQTARVPGK